MCFDLLSEHQQSLLFWTAKSLTLTETVGGSEMGLQEVSAHVAEGSETEQTGALQEALDILHADDDGARVHEV